MTIEKLKLQNIAGVSIERKRSEDEAFLSVFDEVCEVRFLESRYWFRKQIGVIDELEMNTITRICRCFEISNGGLSYAHARLEVDESDFLYACMEIDGDQIANVAYHDRIIDYVCLCKYYMEVLESHNV